MENILTALVLGLSAENLLVCPFFNPFVTFGLTLSEKLAGLKFLLGRLLGLVIFGILISLLGRSLRIDIKVINLIFGISLLWLGISIIFRKNAECHSRRKQMEGTVGFGLGLLRGMLNPGRKCVYLVPLIMGAGVLKGMVISFAYGLSSSLYLIIGLLSAGLIRKIVPYRHFIRTMGGAILMIIGIFYIYKARGLIL